MKEELQLVNITREHQEVVMPMVQAFYQGPAVAHPVEERILRDSFLAVADPANEAIWGYLLQYQGELAGYLYVTKMFSCEVGGTCLFIEEIYVRPGFQGKGLGKSALLWLEEEFPEVKRLRLEVSLENEGAKRLYQGLGYEFLPYQQMVKEK